MTKRKGNIHVRADGNGLRCIHCNSVRLITTDSRPHNHCVRRLRKCKSCNQTFWTAEYWSNWNCAIIEGQEQAAGEGVL